MVVVDNCCHIRNAIQREFPGISVVLDVWHFMMRYLICISGGTKNPKRAEVARDIVDAILKTTADKYNLAVYWSQEEQETRLIGAYEKWVRIGGVWTRPQKRCTLISWSMYEKDALREFARTSRQMEAVLRGLTKAGMVCSHARDQYIPRALRVSALVASPALVTSPTLVASNSILNSSLALKSTTATPHEPADSLHAPSSGSNQASSGLSARFVVASAGKSSREPIDCDLEFSNGISDKTGRDEGDTFLLEGVQSTGARAHSSTTSESPTMEMFDVSSGVNHQAQVTPRDLNPLPVSVSGLTRSQQLFSISTGIDVRATSIGGGDEYFLFMDLRLKNRWVSFLMTPRKWVAAADEFNMELAKLDKSKGCSTTGKTPRALMDKLGEVEPQVLGHVASGNTCVTKESGDEAFWKKHCALVPLVKPEDGEDRKRKTHTCTRCKMVMYPGPERSAANHKKSYCTDGVRQKPKVIERTLNGVVQKVVEELPEYPQPAGLFTHGTHFHPKIFLAYVVDLYTRLIAHSGPGSEKAMEDAAFAALLTKRLRVFRRNVWLFSSSFLPCSLAR
ncbi:hypothetical protein A0H81_10073 [Grifola frondosa]|uniref:Uncharacterized protein n=1 Tax=Grifola frondosa TaxID=5627 RepID=A0A1C7M3R2_GRIFR|nr:hypothetical protein A0H81_10073 [Grifola frondosa]